MTEVRRFARLAVGALVPALAVAACAPAPLTRTTTASAPSASSQEPTAAVAGPAEPPAPAQACLAEAQALSPERQVGQLLMVGVSLQGLDEPTRQALRATQAGSVVLLGSQPITRSDVASLSAEIRALGDSTVPILVAADQEGGRVQRLRGQGFSEIPSAVDQGAMNPDALRVQAETWADELLRAGVRFNLAPVADVVPESKVDSNAPIGKLDRQFGASPEQAAEAVEAVVGGMESAGVATSLKHFPGLGKVTANTDFDEATDADTVVDDPSWEPFLRGIEAGASSVMISSATFERIDPEHRAVFSSRIVSDILREDLGFDKVVIADDLGAAESVADVPPGERAVAFLEAGGDLIVNADPALAEEMATAILEHMADDAFASRVETSTARVLALKESVGDVDCA